LLAYPKRQSWGRSFALKSFKQEVGKKENGGWKVRGENRNHYQPLEIKKKVERKK